MSTNRHPSAPPSAILLAAGLWASHTFGAPGPVQQVPVEDLAADPAITPQRTAEDDPAAQCYFAARADSVRGGSGEEATFTCDLAVRMARDAAGSGAGDGAVVAALGNRSLVLARTGRLEPALADLNAALALAPDDVRLHGNRGNLLLRLGRLEEALAAHDRAVSLAPENPEVYYNRAFVHRALGEPGLAAEDVARARQRLGGVSSSGTRGPAAGRGR